MRRPQSVSLDTICNGWYGSRSVHNTLSWLFIPTMHVMAVVRLQCRKNDTVSDVQTITWSISHNKPYFHRVSLKRLSLSALFFLSSTRTCLIRFYVSIQLSFIVSTYSLTQSTPTLTLYIRHPSGANTLKSRPLSTTRRIVWARYTNERCGLLCGISMFP